MLDVETERREHYFFDLPVPGSPLWIAPVSFVVLRGYRFSLSVFLRGPSGTPFESFPTPWSPLADPLPDLWQSPLEPPPTPSWPFAVLRGPSWISFCLFVEIFSPFPTLGGSLLSFLQPLRGPSCPFVDNSFSLRALRGSPSWISCFPSLLVGLRRSLAKVRRFLPAAKPG